MTEFKYEHHMDIALFDGSQYQVRTQDDEETIERYRALYEQDGPDALPELRVTGKDYNIVLDGHHRLEAARRAHMEVLPYVRVMLGSEKYGFCGVDCEGNRILAAIQANAKSGLALTREDRKKAALTLMEAFPRLSLRDIASEVGLSKSTIENLKKEKKVSNLDSDEQKSEPFPTTHCGNPGCSLTCSPVYLSDPDCDWIESDGVLYCSDECREIAREKRLEKQADEILENDAESELTEEDCEEEGLRDYTEEEDESSLAPDVPALRATPPKEQNHKCCPFCGEDAEVEIEQTSIGENFQVHCSNLDCEIWPRTQWKSNVAAAWEIWDTRKGEKNHE